MFTTERRIVLASKSPRRRSYLEDLGLDFKVSVAEIDERPLAHEHPYDYVSRIAKSKALTIMEQFPESWVLAADTTVLLDNVILGKPNDQSEAIDTLMLLSGRTHEVATSFTLGVKSANILYDEIVKTAVTFSPYTLDVAKAYVKTGESFDKAGAYGIQGMGAFLVREIHGSYSNVVGLPLSQLIAAMQRYKIVAVS